MVWVLTQGFCQVMCVSVCWGGKGELSKVDSVWRLCMLISVCGWSPRRFVPKPVNKCAGGSVEEALAECHAPQVDLFVQLSNTRSDPTTPTRLGLQRQQAIFSVPCTNKKCTPHMLKRTKSPENDNSCHSCGIYSSLQLKIYSWFTLRLPHSHLSVTA